MVAESQQTKRAHALIALLTEIADAHEQLLAAIDEKIAAMKSGDSERIRRSTEQEQTIVERINEREGLRRNLTENIVSGYGVGKTAAARMNAARLADRIGEPFRAQINETTERLRSLTTRIARRNHVARMISANVIRHVGRVMDAMSGRNSGAGYSNAGGVTTANRRSIFEAVG